MTVQLSRNRINTAMMRYKQLQWLLIRIKALKLISLVSFLIFMYLGLQVSTCLISDTDFHVSWITTFNLFDFWYLIFMCLGLQVSTCFVSDTSISCTLDYKFQLLCLFLLHSEHINLFVYTVAAHLWAAALSCFCYSEFGS